MSNDSSQKSASNGAPKSVPPCTVIICTRNRPSELKSCILSLLSQSYENFELLVVENSETATEAKAIAASTGAGYLLCRKIGLSAARNAGLRACRTDFAAFIDDDAIPDSQWLENLLCEFSDPQVTAVTGWCIYEPAGPRPPVQPQRWCVDRNTPDWFAMANFGGLGDGGSMAFRRSALGAWPGFDERLGRGATLCDSEEHHAFFSLIELGHKVVHTPMAIIRHPAAPHCRENDPPGSQRGSTFMMLRPVFMSTAYMTFLACEYPEYAHRVAKFIWEAIRHKPRNWGNRSGEVFAGSSPRWQVYLALLLGPLIYLYMRIRNPLAKRSHAGAAQAPITLGSDSMHCGNTLGVPVDETYYESRRIGSKDK